MNSDERNNMNFKGKSLAYVLAIFISTLGSLGIGLGIYSNHDQSMDNQYTSLQNQSNIENLNDKYSDLKFDLLSAKYTSRLPSVTKTIEPPETYACKCSKTSSKDQICRISPTCDEIVAKACEVMFVGYNCKPNVD